MPNRHPDDYLAPAYSGRSSNPEASYWEECSNCMGEGCEDCEDTGRMLVLGDDQADDPL